MAVNISAEWQNTPCTVELWGRYEVLGQGKQIADTAERQGNSKNKAEMLLMSQSVVSILAEYSEGGSAWQVSHLLTKPK